MGNSKLSNRELFFNKMEEYMNTEYKISKSDSKQLVEKYRETIKVDIISQQLGYDYLALQILMEEGLIPYRPI